VKSLRFIACLAVSILHAQASVDPQGAEFFETKIQPIFQEHCYKCHSHGDKIKGGLVVDSHEGVLTGGDSGPAVLPGNPEKSLLIEAVRYENEDLQMPPKNKKLSDEQIALLTEWVKRGAPWAKETGQKMAKRVKGKITDEDRQWWAFQPVKKIEPPAADAGWGSNEIDRFILARLKAEALQPAPPAPAAQLARRLYFDLTGLPPKPEEVASFAAAAENDRQGATAELVDRLLASPQYGERWARHWLDLVRYAESDGYRVDDYRPNAWRYRDYVIRSLNADKPYDRFVQEQLAGDEIAPEDPDARIATGYLTHWIYEYNNRDAVTQWSTILNDVTDTTADVFMGMGVQCARCHDHKFDPILQKDYYRLQAFFAPLMPYAEGTVATAGERAAYEQKLADYNAKTADLRRQLDEIEAPYRKQAAEDAITKFPPETQAIIRKPAAERTPFEQQIAELANRQVDYEYLEKRFAARVKEPAKSQRIALLARLKAFEKDKPAPLPVAPQAADVGPIAPAVFVPKKQQLGEIEPGFLTLLDEKPAAIPSGFKTSTGRRAALAQWLTRADNPLTARVIVNRVWQYHFGRGLAVNASDFGKLGEAPSHPELLDWLTHRFVADGWSFKKLHRNIVLSATYQQSITNPIAEQARLKDPENKLLWRANTKRLDAEQIRDAVLAVTGELDLTAAGEGVDASRPRRTIYNKVIRNTRDPVLDVFDAPEGFASMSQRNVTTTPTQSLLMINSKWTLARARAFASRLRKENSSDEAEQITDAFRLAFNREPKKSEIESARTFLAQQAALLAQKEAPTEIAPFAGDKMAFRDGRAAQLMPGSPQDRLVVPASPAFPKANFTVEAFITLKSVYESGSVRTIVPAGRSASPAKARATSRNRSCSSSPATNPRATKIPPTASSPACTSS
jgi:mono/diheme cytochrome c family protein